MSVKCQDSVRKEFLRISYFCWLRCHFATIGNRLYIATSFHPMSPPPLRPAISVPRPVILQRRHVVQHSIDSRIQNIHDLMSLKGTMAAFLPPRPQNVQVYEHGDGRICGRKGDLQPLDQCVDRHDRLTEQEIGDAPDHRVLASSTCFEEFPPAISDV